MTVDLELSLSHILASDPDPRLGLEPSPLSTPICDPDPESVPVSVPSLGPWPVLPSILTVSLTLARALILMSSLVVTAACWVLYAMIVRDEDSSTFPGLRYLLELLSISSFVSLNLVQELEGIHGIWCSVEWSGVEWSGVEWCKIKVKMSGVKCKMSNCRWILFSVDARYPELHKSDDKSILKYVDA